MMTMEADLTTPKNGRYTCGNAPDAERTTKGSATKGNTRPSSRATAASGGSNPPRTLDEKTQQRLAARLARLEANRQLRALFLLCAAETATVYESDFGDYKPKPPGQKPEISDGSGYGVVPHDDALQADCDRLLRLLAEAPDIDPDAPPVKIDGEYIGCVRGKILQGLARAAWYGTKVTPRGYNAEGC